MEQQHAYFFCKEGLVCAGIKYYLNQLNVSVSFEQVESWQELMNQIQKNNPIVFVNISQIPEPASFSLEKLKSKYPKLRLIGLEQKKIDIRIEPYLESYIRFDESEEKIITQLKKVFLVSNTDQIEPKSINSEISEREREVVREVALGKTNKEISDALSISAHTVITHRKNITAKLGIKTIAGLTVYAVLNGIIEPDEV